MDLNLICCENSECLRADVDPAIVGNPRLLTNLLKTEEYYIPNSSYFECVQTDITPKIRKIVTGWMFEVCADQKCLEEVFPLAVNMLDRYLSAAKTAKSRLQLVAVVCLLIASKLREPEPLDVRKLVQYTDNSVDRHQITMMETLVTVTLRYDLLAVTALDFLYPIILSLPVNASDTRIQRHAETLIALCIRDSKFINHPPSLIAGGCVIAALRGLDYRLTAECSLPNLLNRLHSLLGIEKDYLETCYRQVEEMVSEEFMTDIESSQHAKAQTPTDVHDVHF